MSPTRPHDPFGPTADPSAYVPRLALEAALAQLVEAIGQTPACAVLIGEPGLGKTLLLRVLAERLEGAYECLYVPFPRLDPAEFWTWVAAAIGIPRRSDDRKAVLEYARERAADGQGVVLLVDDAGALPPETRDELIDACRNAGFALVMTFSADDRMQPVDLPPYVRRIELGPPMTPVETRAYVRARLRRVDPEGVIAERLDSARIAELHEASGGVPARLHALLDAWLRGRPVEPPLTAPPEPMPVPTPTRPAVAVAREPFFRRREKRRNQLALAILVVLLFAGYWRFAPQRAPSVGASDVAAEPPREQAPPPETTELVPAPAPEPALEPALEPEPAADEAPEPTVDVAPDVSSPPAEELPPPEPEPESTAPTEPVAVAPPVEAVAPPPVPPPVSLAPPPAGARISVDAVPWAEIQLDGRPMGETPLGELPVSPGSHRVSAKLPDGRVLERRVEVRAGDVYVVFP
jgi:type II secretory pathway predicted ATPase ExeA